MDVDCAVLICGEITYRRGQRTTKKVSPLDEAGHYEAPSVMDADGLAEGPET